MKHPAFIVVLLSFIYVSSCKKEESHGTENVFVKSIACDSDVAVVGSLQLEDGNYLIVARDYLETIPGRMIKMDASGKVLWEKRVSPATRVLWKTFLVPGTGYATFGYEVSAFNNMLNVCVYNNDGELLQTKMLNSGFENNAKLPYDMLPLKNGNFAFAGGDWLNLKGRLTITDNNFNVLFNRIYSTPAVYQGFFIRGICEKADGNIFFTASTVGNNSLIYPIVLRTGSTGIQKSQKIIIDNIYNETPNCLINYKDGMLGVSSRMAGEIYPNNNGALVNYLNNELAGLISSRINLNQYDTAGIIIGRKEIINYLGNGMINSLKSTSDGGFILCGTVNQSNFTSILSATKIYLLKIDANLNEQWSQSINTAYQAYGVDAFQTTDGGYLVSGHQRSFDKIFEMVVIKTDASGNIK